MQPISTNSSLIVYASLLVSLCSHLGIVVSQDDALAIIAGVVALAATIYQHFQIKKTNALGLSQGIFKK